MQNQNHDTCKDALSEQEGTVIRNQAGQSGPLRDEAGAVISNQAAQVTSHRSARKKQREGWRGGTGLEFDLVEPWPEAVNGAALLNELEEVMRRFVVLPKYAAETLALWTLHTYAFQYRDVSTYLGIESPEKRCGKTTLLSLLSEIVHRPVASANISSSALFRVIEEAQPTLLIDEADTFLQGNDEIRGILNSGYTRKTAYVVRVANQVKSSDLRVKNGDQGDEELGPPHSNSLLRSRTHHVPQILCWTAASSCCNLAEC